MTVRQGSPIGVVPLRVGGPRFSRTGRRYEGASLWQVVLVSSIVATLGMRIFEFFPALSVIKPIMLLVVGSLAALAVTTAGRSLVSPLDWSFARWMLLFFAWMVVCIPTSVWVGVSVSTVRASIPTILGVWVILTLPASRRVGERLQLGFVLGAVLFAVLNVLMGGEQFAGRYGGALGMDVNDIALVLAVCLPLTLGRALRSHGLQRLALWAATALIAVVIMRTGSRGGGLALAAGVIVLLAGISWRRSLQLLLLGVPLSLAVWTTAPESFRTRMSALFAGEEDYNQTDNNGRIAIWKRGISYGLQHPVLGVGPGGFITQDGIGKKELGLSGKWSTAHNTYVQVFAEMGFPGLLLFFACVGTVGKSCFRVFRNARFPASFRRPEYLASLVAYLVGATFLSFLFYQMTWVLFAGLAVMATGACTVMEQSASGISPGRPLQAHSGLQRTMRATASRIRA